MQGGVNNLWQIGHDIFRVGDLDTNWPSVTSKGDPTPGLMAGAAMASLLYPDRVPWFLLS
jgi:hypothetical protein